ncbi:MULTISPECIES: hypothetical protein [Providencia]|uniref:hypothetical protein n=1 Tax=Providencia TaxID=586 RepID=UPI0021D4E6E5|nr:MULTISPECIES: hypothetical protein [Providencia]WIE07374.1 hypothetical protein N4838_016020 [Providencia rettgeri]
MSIVSAVALKSITVTSNSMDFTRPDIDVTKIAAKFKLHNALEEDEELKNCKLTFSSKVIGKLTDQEDDPDFDSVDHEFKFSLSVDYEFEIIDEKQYSSMNEDEKTELCASITYLDFRRRMTMNANNIGISSFRMPLSLAVLVKKSEK